MLPTPSSPPLARVANAVLAPTNPDCPAACPRHPSCQVGFSQTRFGSFGILGGALTAALVAFALAKMDVSEIGFVLLAGPDGPLGRYHSGHISAKIANLVLCDPAHFLANDYFLDSGVIVRRRFTFPPEVQRREELLNIALYADNPPLHSVDHRDGVLSLAWLALATPILGHFLAESC